MKWGCRKGFLVQTRVFRLMPRHHLLVYSLLISGSGITLGKWKLDPGAGWDGSFSNITYIAAWISARGQPFPLEMTCWLLNYKPQIQWDKHQECPLSKTRQQIHIVLESLILKHQILPVEFPLTHDNSFQVSPRNFLISLWRSRCLCLHRNLPVALPSVKHTGL